MTTRLLVLGGSGFVGGALVAEGLARGWEVTTFNRGRRERRRRDAAQIDGDRTDPATLTPLRDRDWDVVADTWSGAPRAVRDSAAALAERAGRYVYISSGSVYGSPLPIGLDEDAPTVTAHADDGDGDYAANKRGAELAVVAALGDRALIARAGSIVGPGDDVGRLLWWLTRMSDGGDVLAPGPRNLPQQLIDVRDLARFVLDDHAGTYNVVSRPEHTTMEGLLEACVTAAGAPGTELIWLEPAQIERAGIEEWSELPLWMPPGHPMAGLLGMDTERAHAAGLRCRPIAETVGDTWEWMCRLPGPPSLRADLTAPGLPRAKELAALQSL
jgi:nucleoside-diphosphate-sugar epimerase